MKKILSLSFGIVTLFLQTAAAQYLESWENTLDGWTVDPLGKNPTYTASFSTTTGVTDGSYSLALTGLVYPNYAQLLSAPTSTNMTALLAGCVLISIDVYAPTGSFGNILQFDIDIDNADTGYVSIDNFIYEKAIIGGESNITFTVPSDIQAELALSTNPTTLYIQIGGSDTIGNETMYLDNFQIHFPPDGTIPTPTQPSILPTNTFYAYSVSGVTLSESSRGAKPLYYQWQTDGGGGRQSDQHSRCHQQNLCF